jgi:hypothetical protein
MILHIKKIYGNDRELTEQRAEQMLGSHTLKLILSVNHS